MKRKKSKELKKLRAKLNRKIEIKLKKEALQRKADALRSAKALKYSTRPYDAPGYLSQSKIFKKK